MNILPNQFVEIELEKIMLNTSQARQRDTKVDEDDDLVHSIKKDGLIYPVIVKKIEDGKYELLVGQRRFSAHEILKISTIKAFVLDKDIDEFEAKKMSLVENAARKDMKRADYVDNVQIFMDRYGKTSTVAEELGLSVGTVRKYLIIGRLPEKLKEEVKKGTITAANAIKALDALGGDESNVDDDDLLDTAIEIEKLSPPARVKFVDIKLHEKDSTPSEVAEKAKKQLRVISIILEVTDDQSMRINKFKDENEIESQAEAAERLVSMGLDAADV